MKNCERIKQWDDAITKGLELWVPLTEYSTKKLSHRWQTSMAHHGQRIIKIFLSDVIWTMQLCITVVGKKIKEKEKQVI